MQPVSCIKKPLQLDPFINKIGESFTIAVDKKPFLQVSMEAAWRR